MFHIPSAAADACRMAAPPQEYSAVSLKASPNLEEQTYEPVSEKYHEHNFLLCVVSQSISSNHWRISEDITLYIDRPLLIDGRKFDLRAYLPVLILILAVKPFGFMVFRYPSRSLRAGHVRVIYEPHIKRFRYFRSSVVPDSLASGWCSPRRIQEPMIPQWLSKCFCGFLRRPQRFSWGFRRIRQQEFLSSNTSSKSLSPQGAYIL